jgi:hypothetical protein
MYIAPVPTKMRSAIRFLQSQPWQDVQAVAVVGGTAGALDRLLLKHKCDRQTPVAKVLNLSRNKQLRIEFEAYLRVVWDCNWQRLTKRDDDTKEAWERFRRAVSFDALFTNQLWEYCDADQKAALYLPLLRPDPTRVTAAAGAGAGAGAASENKDAPTGTEMARVCVAVLEDVRDVDAVQHMTRVWRATHWERLRVKVHRRLQDAQSQLTDKEMPFPMQPRDDAARQSVCSNTKKLAAKIAAIAKSTEDTNDGVELVHRVLAVTAGLERQLREQYTAQTQVPSVVVQLAEHSIVEHARRVIREPLESAKHLVRDVAVPRALSAEGDRVHALLDDLDVDLGRFASNSSSSSVDAKQAEELRTAAFKAAVHLDAAEQLRRLYHLFSDFATVNENKEPRLPTSEALEYMQSALARAHEVKTFEHVDALVAQEDHAVSEVALPRCMNELQKVPIALERWLSLFSSTDEEEKKTKSATADTDWLRPWMSQALLDGNSVRNLSADLMQPLQQAAELATQGDPYLKGLDFDSQLVQPGSETVALSTVLARLRRCALPLYVMELTQSRKRR